MIYIYYVFEDVHDHILFYSNTMLFIYNHK